MKKIIILATFIVSLLLAISYLAAFVSPSESRWIPLLGLSYPIFFTLTSLLLIFWLLKRSWVSLVPLAIILLGWNIHRQFFQFYGTEDMPEGKDKNLSVLSYNVRLFNLYNWIDNRSTRDSIFAILEREEADILCFQEFYYTARKGVFETRDTLIQILPNKYYQEKYTHKFTGEQYFGVATFSKFPIVYNGEIPFESDDNNYCIFSDIAIGEDTIRVYNAHLSSIRFDREDYKFVANEDPENTDLEEGGKRIVKRLLTAFLKREKQVAKLRANVEASPYPVILCGDFNDTPISYTYSQIDDLLNDAFVESGSGFGRTYNGPFPSYRIDYIWYDDFFESYNFKTLPQEYSDHQAIMTYLAY